MGGPWIKDSSHENLHDVRLNEDVEEEGHCNVTQPEQLHGMVHELALVLLAAFIGATFLILQRGTVVISDTVRHSLDMDTVAISWITSSSGLAAAIFLLPVAQIADGAPIASRKFILILSLTVFSLAMGLTTFSSNGIVFDIMLGVAGLASAAHIPIMSSILASIYTSPSTRRQCVFTLFLAGGNAFAVLFGGLGSGLVDTALNGDWRASFIYIAALFGAVVVASIFVIPKLPQDESLFPDQSQQEDQLPLLSHPTEKSHSQARDWSSVVRSVDWLGLFLLLCGVCLFTIATTLAPELGWRSPFVVLPLTGGGGAFGLFGWWTKRSKRPLIPESIWRDTSLLFTLFSTLCLSMAFFACLFWLSFFMQDMQNLNPLEVGVRLLPQAVTGLVLSPIIGCWMHRVNNALILAAAAMLQVGASILVLFLRRDSNYFAFIFPSLILSTLSMDWVRNVGAQYIVHALPLADQVRGAAVLQIVTRLAIPMAMGITTVIWGSYNPAPKLAFSPSDDPSLASLQHAYSLVFVATLCFSVAALLVSPFACVGRLGVASVASTASDRSIPQIDSGLRNLNHDGPTDLSHGTRPIRSSCAKKRVSQLIQPRTSSLGSACFKNVWKRSSVGANSSFHLPQIPGTRASADTSGLGLGVSLMSADDDRKSQRDSMAMAERVIWLVCEDCGSSKRIVEPVGDPKRYFYDGDVCDGDKNECENGPTRLSKRSSTPMSPTSAYDEPDIVAGPGTTGVRRFALINR